MEPDKPVSTIDRTLQLGFQAGGGDQSVVKPCIVNGSDGVSKEQLHLDGCIRREIQCKLDEMEAMQTEMAAAQVCHPYRITVSGSFFARESSDGMNHCWFVHLGLTQMP